jgi:D-lactate dehydrogenase
LLGSNVQLPIAAEYLHRDTFDIAEIYGKDTYLLIKMLGTRRLPRLFALKSRMDAFAERMPFLPRNLSDLVLQALSHLAPPHLPVSLRRYRDRFEHHLMLKVAGTALDATRDFLSARFPSKSGDVMECSAEDGAAAFLHRFAAAGAAVRYRNVHQATTGDIVALDVALPRNALEWREKLPEALDRKILKKLYYGHFFCYVFHQDYLIGNDVDWQATEDEILRLLDKRSAKYPAEHNVGHLYHAEEAVAAHYRALDPCLNPGIGHTSKRLRWG